MGIYPNRLILSSSFGTLKNDTQSNSLSITIPSGTSVTRPTIELGRQTLAVGEVNSPIRARMKSSKYDIWRVGTSLYSQVSTTSSLDPTPQDLGLWCTIQRISATEVALILSLTGLGGGMGETITTDENITIEAVFSTYLQPAI